MNERLVTPVWAVILSLTAVFGAMGCMVSGFELNPLGFGTVTAWILAAVVFTLCFRFRIGLYPMAGLVLLGIYLWVRGYLSGSGQLLVQELFEIYDNAYGWGVPAWSEIPPADVTTGTAVCWLGLPIVICTSYSVLRRRIGWLAVGMMVLPLGCCMIVTDTVPGVLPLFVLLLTVVLLLMTHTVRRRDEQQGNRLLAILALPVAAGLCLLFLLIPRDSYDRQSGAQKLEDAVVSWLQGDFEIPDIPQPTLPEELPPVLMPTVGSGSVARQENLSMVGPKVQSDMRIMSVTSEQGGLLYLRGLGYDVYTGTSWTVEALEDGANWPSGELLTDGGLVEISTATVHDALYLPYYVSRDSYAGMEGGRLFNGSRSRTYSFFQSKLPAEYLVTGAQDQYSQAMEPWLELPETTQVWAREVLVDIFGTDKPPLTASTVNAIAAYVRASAEYDLSTPRMSGSYEDFAQWFLEKSDTGYCIHFATSTAVLLRAAGIPSRYVTGYTVFAAPGETVTVTGKHAHAWAEFCLPGKPWYPLESTPEYHEQEVPIPTVPEFTIPTRPELEETTQPETAPTIAPEKPVLQENGKGLLGWILAAALCASAVIQWRLRVRLRRLRHTRGRSKQRALARWQTHVRMAKLLKEQPDRELLNLAQKAKFSQHPISGEELARFTEVMKNQQERLSEKPLYLRLYYRLILALY